jgi:hypothetical protein
MVVSLAWSSAIGNERANGRIGADSIATNLLNTLSCLQAITDRHG